MSLFYTHNLNNPPAGISAKIFAQRAATAHRIQAKLARGDLKEWPNYDIKTWPNMMSGKFAWDNSTLTSLCQHFALNYEALTVPITAEEEAEIHFNFAARQQPEANHLKANTKELRQALGLSLSDAGEHFGCSKAMICHMENPEKRKYFKVNQLQTLLNLAIEQGLLPKETSLKALLFPHNEFQTLITQKNLPFDSRARLGDEANHLKANMKRLRQALGLTLNDATEHFGCSKATVFYMENPNENLYFKASQVQTLLALAVEQGVLPKVASLKDFLLPPEDFQDLLKKKQAA